MLISSSLILSVRLRAFSNLLNFASAVAPLYLYVKSTGLTSVSSLLFFPVFRPQVF